jgi:hypothetical protein
MRTLSKTIQLLFLLLIVLAPALADIPPPDNSKRKPPKNSNLTSRMTIKPDQTATEAKLVIPRALLRQLRAANGESETDPATGITSVSNLSRTQTLMGGLFLSLAVVSAGIWFLGPRKGKLKLPPAALSIAVVSICGLVATVAYANFGPPPELRSLTSKILVQQAQDWGAYGQVKVELVEGDGEITLVLPKKAEDLPK